ncbi:M48 family metalloprotease [Nocardia brasiliensis]|uniref:M48 family metalloprotease n=1 Tax=Nocardia brasiliensis TaxID=37326 RepID=UPI0036728134
MTAGNGQFDQSKPDGFQHYLGGLARYPAASPIRRRTVRLPTALTLILGIPWFALSIIVVSTLAALVSSNNTIALATTGLFVMSGAAVFFGRTEYFIARVMFRYRQPTMAEQHRLDQVWGAVTQRAGVRSNDYRLWVQDTDELNAFAAAGHIVAVTRAALSLPPPRLAAVLAHELGHHLAGHSWAALLTYWYSLPGRLVARVLYRVTHFVFAIFAGFTVGAAGGAVAGRAGGAAAGCVIAPLVRLFPFLLLALTTWFFYSIHPALVLLWATPFVVAGINRHQEKSADRTAADLGYGLPLLEILYGWLHAGHDDARQREGLRANLFASHPSCAARIQALEKHLYGPNRTGGGGR